MKFFNFIKKLLGIRKRKEKIRNVIFGLRIRAVFLLSIVLLFTCFLFVIFIYFIQYNLILKEKNERFLNLTSLMEGSSSLYLYYKDSKLPKEELTKNYLFISNEISKFKELNSDVNSIFLLDDRNRVSLSLPKSNKFVSELIKIQKKEKTQKLSSKEIKEKIFDKSKKKKYIKHYRMVYLPVILQTGDLILINNDFDEIVTSLHKKGINDKKKQNYHALLVNKYKELMENQTNIPFYSYSVDEIFIEIYKNLFKNIGKLKYEYIKDNWLFNKNWLSNLNQKVEKALSNNNLIEAKKYDEEIYINMQKIRSYGEDFKYLGVLGVVFDLSNIKLQVNKNQIFFIILASLIFVLSVILVFIATGHILRNIKKMEKWALEIANGNLDYQIKIKQKDEIGRLADVFQMMIEELIEKYHLEKFVSSSTISMISQKRGEIEPGKVGRKKLAFLFSDIRGFTSFSEKNEPETVIEILNLYFERQVKIIKKYRGDIDDYVGDQIMAHFDGENKADTVVLVATEIMREISKLNEERQKNNLPYFEIGIGIHIGDVVIGNIGTELRMDFACIGDAVNTASRLCSIARPYEIIASKTLITETKKFFSFEELAPVKLKGKESPFEIVRIKW